MQEYGRFRAPTCVLLRPAFTLVELLVVLGIITVLVGMLLPTVSAFRRDARTLRCLSNTRQLALAMTAYASAFKNKFPPNVSAPSPGQWWHDSGRIGSYLSLPPTTVMPDAESSVWICPEDEAARRSYSMNFWASSNVDAVSIPPLLEGQFFSADVKNASKLLLLVESWSWLGNPSTGVVPLASVGSSGTPGQRFGANSGIGSFSAGRWGYVNCQLTYSRHRRMNGPGQKVEAKGRIVIAFADTHVELLSHDALADYITGQLRGTCYWSPLDFR